MSDIQFDPTLYRGKKTIYRKVPSVLGIASIWDWNAQKRKYVRRTEGLQYCAYKRIQGLRQVSQCFVSLQEAKAWRERSTPVRSEGAKADLMAFAEVKKQYFDRAKGRLQVTTYETYESNAKHLALFDPLPMSGITAKTVDEWLIAVKKPEYLGLQHKSRLTYHAELSVLRQILVHYAEYIDDTFQVPLKKRHLEDAIVEHTRYKQAQDRNRQHFIPRRDFEAFLDELFDRADSKPERLVFWVLAELQLGGGPRIGEACAVTFDDILDWDSGAVAITKTVQWSRKEGRPTRISPLTKTGESRPIYLTSRAMNALRRWKEACGRSKGLIFSFDGFTPVPYRSVQHHYEAAFQKLGMKWRSTHILRHSYSTDFLEKTGNKAALQGQLGHKTSKQTDHYAKITDAAQQDGVRSYDERLRRANVVAFVPRMTGVEKPEVLGGLLGENQQRP